MVLIRRDEGYWRQYAKVARSGLIALLVLLSLPEVGLCQNKVAPKSQTENSQTEPQAPPQPPVFIHNPGPYEPHCASPPTREDAEYCQEWGATIAAQKQAEWAFYQLIASVVGIGAVIVTLVFTAKATAAAVDSVDASQRSADAAARAAEIAERALVDLERPYVFITRVLLPERDIRQKRGETVLVPHVHIVFQNYGRTPTVIREFRCAVSIVTTEDKPKTVLDINADYHLPFILGGGEDSGVFKMHIGEISAEAYTFFRVFRAETRINVKITYESIFDDAPVIENFSYRYDHNVRLFLLQGGAPLHRKKKQKN